MLLGWGELIELDASAGDGKFDSDLVYVGSGSGRRSRGFGVVVDVVPGEGSEPVGAVRKAQRVGDGPLLKRCVLGWSGTP